MQRPATALTSDAERQRRCRKRKGLEERYMHGDVPADTLRALVKNGWLDLDETKDPEKLGAALADLADCWVRGTLEPPQP